MSKGDKSSLVFSSVTFLASCESERERNLHRAVMKLFFYGRVCRRLACVWLWAGLIKLHSWDAQRVSAHSQSQRPLFIHASV